MAQTVYVVQPFSRDRNGVLAWDAPTWSRDRSFAVSLTHSLSKRKAGVMTVGVTVDSAGGIGSEAEVVASCGTVPTAMIVSGQQSLNQDSAIFGESLQRRA
jgi:hypothetical protein